MKKLYLLILTLLAACQPESPATQASASREPAAAPVVAVSAPVAVQEKTPAPTTEMQLAQASKCFSCHAIDRKLVGPAWKDVAAKYRGQKGAEVRLVEKVAKGGSGVWGAVPMPPNSPQVGEGDIRTLVRYILGLR
jgi:cytochrome c